MRHDALLGRRVANRFTIKRYIGEGGMATVYAAEQDAEPRQVALKIMNQELMADRSFVHRFQREAQAASRVQHPNSVQIIDYGVTGSLSYIAMELLVGDDLYVLLERQGALPQARAARILIEVCDALVVAHELGIVHRDLKPENIMVLVDPSHPNGERVKVLDFGIAKLIASDAINYDEDEDGEPPSSQSSAVTHAGTFIGTPAYMSPEQCSLLTVDTRADIYTCGVLLFQLVTGRLPFEGQTPLHTATLHIHEPPPRPSSFAPGINAQLEAVILKALAKRPDERHQTARHLGDALRRLLPELTDSPVAAGPVSKRPQNSWRPPPSGGVNSRPRPLRREEPDAPMTSAKTIVADELVDDRSAPPAVVLHESRAADSSPTNVRPLPPVKVPYLSDRDEVEDSSRTLIRPSLIDAKPYVPEDLTQPYIRPKELLGTALPARQQLPTLKSEDGLPPAGNAGADDPYENDDLAETFRNDGNGPTEPPPADDSAGRARFAAPFPPPPLAPSFSTAAPTPFKASLEHARSGPGPDPMSPMPGARVSSPGLPAASAAHPSLASSPRLSSDPPSLEMPRPLRSQAKLPSPWLFIVFFMATLLASLGLLAYSLMSLRLH